MSSLRALSGATPITGEFTESRAVVRKRTANASNESLGSLISILKRENFSGTITVGMTQGNIRTLSAEDRQSMPD